MSKERLECLDEVKELYPEVYEQIKEQFSNHNKKLNKFELDYFIYDLKTCQFFLSMSSGITKELEQFDMSGEIDDEDVAVYNAEFTKQPTQTDLYDTEDIQSLDSTDEENYYNWESDYEENN